jgi:rhodanese-related sulfurtransferase
MEVHHEEAAVHCLAAGLAVQPTGMVRDRHTARWVGQDIRSPEGLRKLIERKDPRFVIVDVRSPAEYAAGHIPTAISVPGGITADIKAPPSKDKYLVLYCHGGMKSPAAGEKMRADGYRHVLVWGGIVN